MSPAAAEAYEAKVGAVVEATSAATPGNAGPIGRPVVDRTARA